MFAEWIPHIHNVVIYTDLFTFLWQSRPSTFSLLLSVFFFFFNSSSRGWRNKRETLVQLSHYIFSLATLPSAFLKFFGFCFCFVLGGHTTWHAESLFPNQGSNLHPHHWKHSLNHWTSREVPYLLLLPHPSPNHRAAIKLTEKPIIGLKC